MFVRALVYKFTKNVEFNEFWTRKSVSVTGSSEFSLVYAPLDHFYAKRQPQSAGFGSRAGIKINLQVLNIIQKSKKHL